MTLEEALNEHGLKAVEKYRQSFIDNDRVATGKTNESVVHEVINALDVYTLIVKGRKDINQLEEGVTAEQYSSNPANFSDLEQWITSRGLNRTALSIDRGLKLSGWSTEGSNRTGQNGGTANIITTPTEQIKDDVLKTVKDMSKSIVLNIMKK